MGMGKLLTDKLDEQVAQAMINAEAHMAKLASSMAEFQNGNRLTGARPITIDSGTPRITVRSGRLVGWSVYADGGSAKVRLRERDTRNGADGGDTIAAFSLAADGSMSHVWFGPGGVSFGEGLWLEKVAGTGTVVGTVFVGARD